MNQIAPLNQDIKWVREAKATNFFSTLKCVFAARGLIKFFALLTLRKTTKRTLLGWIWLPFRCLWPILVTTLVMGNFLNVQSKHAPYIIFFISGLIPWTLFAISVSWVTRCIELSRSYVRRCAFPRLVLPIAYLAPALLDASMLVAFFAVIVAWHQIAGDYSAVVPGISSFVGGALAISLGLGIGLILSIPGARVRDVRFILGFILGGVFALTPVAYTAEGVPSKWSWIVDLNPIAIAVEGCRSGLLGSPAPAMAAWIFAWAVAGVLLVTGMIIFTKYEAILPDVV